MDDDKWLSTSTDISKWAESLAGIGKQEGVFARETRSGWRAYVTYWFQGYSDHPTWGNEAGQQLHVRWRVIRDGSASRSEREELLGGRPITASTLDELKAALVAAAAQGHLAYGFAEE